MKIIIGIISYLPNNERIRKNRKDKLNKLLDKCRELFPTLEIHIIAQNWDNNVLLNDSNTIVYLYKEPLGITGARKLLREVFLYSTDADYLIMIDDDCKLEGNSGEKYLNQIKTNPNCFIEFNLTLLKLFAISRYIFEKEYFENINPENEEGFEDRIFVNKLRKKYPNYQRKFTNTGIIEESISTKDPDSTWYCNQNLKEMIKKSQEIIKNL